MTGYEALGVTDADLEPPWGGCGSAVGMPRRGDCPHPAELRSLAHHEAGHACVALSLGITVFYATVIPKYDCAGHVRHAQDGMTIEDGLLMTLAGPAAQRRYFPLLREFEADLEDHMGRFDTAHARALLAVLHGADHDGAGDFITVDLARWRVRADQLVHRQWAWIAVVARALEQRQRLSGDEIARLNRIANRRREASAR